MGDPSHHPKAAANAHAAAVLAQALMPQREIGCVRHVVAAPGSRHTPLLLALAAQPQVRLHMVLDERAAGFVALGLAKATGQATILCCTSGSAGAHFLPAIVEASASQVPLVVLTADRPPELQDCGAPQTMPQGQLFAPYVRRELTLPVPEPGALGAIAGAWRVQTARALILAERVQPGPVHLNVPFREPLWVKPDAALKNAVSTGAKPVRICVAARGVEAADATGLATLLSKAQRGLIVVGPLASDAPSLVDAQAILQLAQRLGWPCIVDGCSQLRFSGASDAPSGFSLVTTADVLLRQPAFVDTLPAPDVIVRFGQLPTSKTLWTWIGRMGANDDTTTVLVDGQGDWADPAHVGDMMLLARPLHVCAALKAPLDAHEARPATSAWQHRWRRGQKAAHRAIGGCLDAGNAKSCKAPLSEAFIAHALCQALAPEALVHVASSMPIRDVEAFGQMRKSKTQSDAGPRVSCSRGVNGIDGTLATLLGLALASSNGPVVGLMGDLAFLHDIASLQLARQLGVSAVAIVINNAGGDIFAHLPIAALDAHDLPAHAQSAAAPFDAYFRTPQKADMGALCRAAHVDFRQVTSCEAFGQTLRDIGIVACGAQTPRQAGLVVIEVVVDAAQSRQARRLVHGAVAHGLSTD